MWIAIVSFGIPPGKRSVVVPYGRLPTLMIAYVLSKINLAFIMKVFLSELRENSCSYLGKMIYYISLADIGRSA